MIQLKRHSKEKNRIKKLNRAIETQLAAIERGVKYAFLQAVWKQYLFVLTCGGELCENSLYKKRERIFIVWEYFQSRSLKTVQERFNVEFPGKTVPDKKSILGLVAKFNEHGTVHNLPHDRTKTVLISQTVAVAGEKLTANPDPSSKSLRCVAKEEGLSYGTAHHATIALKLHPYRVRVVHELKPLNFDRRVMYCEWFLDFIESFPNALHDIVYSDEAWFLLSEYVNNQNNRVWSATNPHVRLGTPLHPEKNRSLVRSDGFSGDRPHFFMQTITSAVYLEIIQDFIALLLIHMRYCWF